MKEEELLKRIRAADAKARKLYPSPADGDEEETDPRILELLDRGDRLIAELDPIVREAMRDKPEALAEWDEIMHMCDDPEEGPRG